MDGNHGSRAEGKRLRNHVVEVALNDKQPVGNVTQALQDEFDLFYGNCLTQVGVNHQYAV